MPQPQGFDAAVVHSPVAGQEGVGGGGPGSAHGNASTTPSPRAASRGRLSPWRRSPRHAHAPLSQQAGSPTRVTAADGGSAAGVGNAVQNGEQHAPPPDPGSYEIALSDDGATVYSGRSSTASPPIRQYQHQQLDASDSQTNEPNQQQQHQPPGQLPESSSVPGTGPSAQTPASAGDRLLLVVTAATSSTHLHHPNAQQLQQQYASSTAASLDAWLPRQLSARASANSSCNSLSAHDTTLHAPGMSPVAEGGGGRGDSWVGSPGTPTYTQPAAVITVGGMVFPKGSAAPGTATIGALVAWLLL